MVGAERCRLATAKKNLDTERRLKRNSVNVKGEMCFFARYGNRYRHEPKRPSFMTWEFIDKDAPIGGRVTLFRNFIILKKEGEF